MKLRRIFAAIAACAVAATMAISASADYEVPADKIVDNTVSLFGADKDGNQTGIYSTIDEVVGLSAIKFTISIDEAAAAQAAAGEAWSGGGIGVNGELSDWGSCEWAFQPDVKPATWTKVSDGVYEVTVKPDMIKVGSKATVDALTTAFFDKTCTFAQVWLQDWTDQKVLDTSSLKLTKVTLIGIDAPKAAGEEKPADSTTEKPADSTKPADDSNKPTGATAGLALAGLAIAGAAVVASKKSK